MRYLAVIPARGGSKAIPKKNIALLNGIPLISYTIKAALHSKLIDNCIVSTDDPEIEQVALSDNIEVIKRPRHLSTDTADTRSVLLHALSVCPHNPDAVITLQPTSPLRTTDHIDHAINLFESTPLADSLVSTQLVPHNFTPNSLMKFTADGYIEPLTNLDNPLRRQDKPTYLARNGAAIYITKTSCLSRFIFGGNLVSYDMNSVYCPDIDTPLDLFVVENFLRGLNH